MLEDFDRLLAAGLVDEDELEDLLEECIGEESSEEKRWIPLCPAFANLKGLTCDEIDKFLEESAPDITHNREWQRKLDNFELRFKKEFDEMHQEVKKFREGKLPGQRDPEIVFWYDKEGKGVKLKEEIMSFLKSTLPEGDLEKLKDMPFPNTPTDIISWARRLNRYYDPNRGWIPLQARDYTRDYLKHVKVYDRDEEYRAFKRIGDKIAARIWSDMTPYERSSLIGATGFENREWADVPPNNIGPMIYDKNGLKSRLLSQDDTIYVTSPRGGHEMLSIFSYANNIAKNNIPSDIIGGREAWDRLPSYEKSLSLKKLGVPIEDASEYIKHPWSKLPRRVQNKILKGGWGKNWLGDATGRIKKIFIVDDIVASASQMRQMVDEIKKKFPEAEMYSVHLCHRNAPRPHDNPLDPFNTEDPNYGHAFWDTRTLGIEDWEDCRIKVPLRNRFQEVGWDGLTKDEKIAIYELEMGPWYNDQPEDDLHRFYYGHMARYGQVDPKKAVNRMFSEVTGRCVSEIITCAFPHSIPDGASDKILVKLMGGRIHTEKRERLEK